MVRLHCGKEASNGCNAQQPMYFARACYVVGTTPRENRLSRLFRFRNVISFFPHQRRYTFVPTCRPAILWVKKFKGTKYPPITDYGARGCARRGGLLVVGVSTARVDVRPEIFSCLLECVLNIERAKERKKGKLSSTVHSPLQTK